MGRSRVFWGLLAFAWMAPLVWGLDATEELPVALRALDPAVTVLNTMLVAATATCLSLLVSLGLAFAAFDAPSFGRAVRILLVPLLLAPRSLLIVPLEAVIRLLDFDGSLLGLTLCLAAGGIPLQALVLSEAVRSRGEEWRPLLLVAGAGPIRQALVLAPLVERVCVALGLVEALRGVNAFLLPLLFTAGTPSLQTLPVRAWQATAGAGPDLQVAIALMTSAPGFLLLGASLAARVWADGGE